jgi:hypothetical protein
MRFVRCIILHIDSGGSSSSSIVVVVVVIVLVVIVVVVVSIVRVIKSRRLRWAGC